MSTVKELEKQLAAKERELKSAEKALGKAHEERRQAKQRLASANEHFTRLRAEIREGATSESYAFRKKLREADEAFEAAKAADEAAAAGVIAAQKAFEAARDEVSRVKEALVAPQLEALRGRVVSGLRRMKENQEALEAEFRALVGIRAELVAALPLRVISKRALRKELLVWPRDEERRAAVASSIKIKGVPPGSFFMEYYKAMQMTAPGGPLEFVPGVEQDYTVPDETDREQVEVLRGDPRLPEVFDRLKELDLGLEFQANGAGTGKFRRIDFETVEREVYLERQAAERR